MHQDPLLVSPVRTFCEGNHPVTCGSRAKNYQSVLYFSRGWVNLGPSGPQCISYMNSQQRRTRNGCPAMMNKIFTRLLIISNRKLDGVFSYNKFGAYKTKFLFVWYSWFSTSFGTCSRQIYNNDYFETCITESFYSLPVWELSETIVVSENVCQTDLLMHWRQSGLCSGSCKFCFMLQTLV